jgi:Domain of unknown function (DUF927)
VVEDDGAETRRLLEIEATLRQRTYRLRVPAGQFASMTWPMEHLGAGAAVWPGFGIKDHARAAIQFLSGDPPERRVYAHLGWREISNTWCYLHAGGAIGPVGPVEENAVLLPPELQRYRLPDPQRYRLPDPPTGSDLAQVIRASLSLLEVAGDLVTVPIYCGIWRATLGGCDSGLHLVRHTGAGKTELAALALQHFGAGLDARHLPGSWLSTDNALETLAFVAKDALLVVDDFCPTGSQYDFQSMHPKADRLFRGQGNAAGRGRLRADGALRPTRPPLGMVLSTGEDVPRGQSLQARLMVVEVPQNGVGALDWQKLTDCQGKAAAGCYAQAMAGFIRWLAPQYREVRQGLREEIAALRQQAYQSGQHRRTPDMVANLAVGLHYFLTFAQEVGAVGPGRGRRAVAAVLERLRGHGSGPAGTPDGQRPSASVPGVARGSHQQRKGTPVRQQRRPAETGYRLGLAEGGDWHRRLYPLRSAASRGAHRLAGRWGNLSPGRQCLCCGPEVSAGWRRPDSCNPGYLEKAPAGTGPAGLHRETSGGRPSGGATGGPQDIAG